MRSLHFILILVFGLAANVAALAESKSAEPLIDPNFEVPDLSAQAVVLEETVAALAERLRAMKAGLSLGDVDQRLDELLLPERPDEFRRHYEIELQLADDPENLDVWQRLARRYLEKGRLDEASAAAFWILDQSPLEPVRAKALTIMAEAAQAKGEHRLALNLYKASLDRHKDRDAEYRFRVLFETYNLTIRDVAVNVERSLPSACVVFSQKLQQPLPLKPEDYVTLEPAADVDVTLRGNQICLNGLRHGGSYTLTVKPGVPGADGGRLFDEAKRRFTVGDRQERVAFTTGTYVLPRSTRQTLPIKSVNLDRVSLRLYRINDRNLASAVLSGMVEQSLTGWSEQAVDQTSGALIWQGSLEVERRPNEEVTSLVPLAELTNAREPGIYVLIGAPETDEERPTHRQQATQWLLVSDIGLTTFEGEDGLHVLARSLETARPLAGVRVTLLARNNEILGTAETDRTGVARLAPGLIRGEGGNRPLLLTAEAAQSDYNFIRLSGPSLDLSDRGVAGRAVPAGADAFLYPERGVYRPGESVHMSVLLRDARAVAVGATPLTLRVFRPNGSEIHRALSQGDEFGGYGFEVPLSAASQAGTWRATAHLDPDGEAVGATTFQVEDFVPQRIALSLSSDAAWLVPEQTASLTAKARFLYGPPAAGLKTEAEMTLEKAVEPFPGYGDYQFGLVQDSYRPERRALAASKTGEDGQVAVDLTLGRRSGTSHPLNARVGVSVFDVGGRPVSSWLVIPVRGRPVEVGLRPQSTGSHGRDEPVAFDLVALDRAGATVPGRRVTFEWVREHYDYNWYQQNGRWQVRATSYDEEVETGEIALDGQGKGEISRRFDTGRYRLDVFDAEGSSAASTRFWVGWRSFAQAPDVPDALELSLKEADLRAGEKLTAFVKAPFAGRAFVAVMSDRLHHVEAIDLPEAGTDIEIETEADWGPGAYLMVTAFRPGLNQPSLLPARAMGLAWFSLDRRGRDLRLTMEVPEIARPRQPIAVPLRIEGSAGKRLNMTFAAVDEGILQLTGYKTPDAGAHYLGQRQMAVGIRDIYGRLIHPAEGALGRVRSGGDGLLARMKAAALENASGPTTRVVKTVALYQRSIEIGPDGRAEVTLDLPDFNGRLRLMALAYGREALGSGEAALVVRDPVASDLILPRFLAPGDKALTTLSLHNLTGEERDFVVKFALDGGLELVDGRSVTLHLADEERREVQVPLAATEVGDAQIRMTVSAEGMAPLEREWDIAVRPAQPYVTARSVDYLEAGRPTSYGQGDLPHFFPATIQANLTLTARPEFNVPALLDSLYRYPYGCTEQATSRALPLLYYAEVAEKWSGDADHLAIRRRVDQGILRALNRQRADGSFAVWQPYGKVRHWLTAYVFDFLTRAQERGYDVPKAAYAHSLDWLKRYAAGGARDRLYARAYALYVLARIGEVQASDVRYFAESYAGQLRTRLGLGHLAAALALVGEPAWAEGTFQRAIEKRRPRFSSIEDYGSDLRDGAAIISLLAEAFPNSERQQRLAEAVEKHFDRTEYFSTQDRAWLLLATHALSTGERGQLHVAVKGEEIAPRFEALRYRFSQTDLAAPFAVDNLGPAPIRFIQSVRGVPIDPLPAVEEGFTLTRRYYQLDGSLADLSAVKRNDRLVVVIEGETKSEKQDHEALIVDLLPAGLEIENAALGGAGSTAAFDFVPQLSRFEFSAARDDRYVAAVNLNGSQRSFAAAYVVRAVTPGEFVLPGSFIEDMYKPQYHARGKVASVVIEP